MSEFSHLDASGRPGMVHVGGKPVTQRRAVARAVVVLPAVIREAFSEGEFHSKKGPVFQTAILAGTMAAKRTSDLIPLCHPIGLDGCSIDITLEAEGAVITAICSVAHRTGVEMEALTAASVAALTIYDMCKGLSPDMVIGELRVLEKTGGKMDQPGS